MSLADLVFVRSPTLHKRLMSHPPLRLIWVGVKGNIAGTSRQQSLGSEGGQVITREPAPVQGDTKLHVLDGYNEKNRSRASNFNDSTDQ
ncbi:hypothetical protein J6590_081275 [Homalodisca vitripennis]|nr:hypothetical protein J6590_081275 [Homalodisca vitripennis]